MASRERSSRLAPQAVLAGRYRLVRRLGSGGMATVWLAEDERLGRPVAIKALADILAEDDVYLRRFRREAEVAARLSHPNLVWVYDYSDEQRPYLVMEYVEGRTLAGLTEKGERVDAARLARELLSAMSHIHAAGIVHRDVKPSNVMIGPEGTARLTDFGIAQPEDASRITQTGQVVGSRGYIAPEVMAGERATPSSDLYSCGMVLRDHVGPDSPRAVRELVGRLVRDDPNSRPRSAAEAAALLEGEPTVPAPRPTAPTDQAAAPARARREIRARPPLRRLLAALVAVAVIGALVFLISTGGGDSPQTAGDGSARDGGAAPGVPAPSDSSDPAEGARLNQEGFDLIQQGQPEAAVPVLERAVSAFPEGTSDLNYAYALFNLGQALRLSGRPEEAIPVLEERAKIDNQRETVMAELTLAREEAGE
jgi:eukaryotic-like serine/threonine-protein kinase